MRINAIIAAAVIALIPLAASAGEIQNPTHNTVQYHRAEGGMQQLHARHTHQHRHAHRGHRAHPANVR
jgi:serine protease inhibitor ecotin